MTTDWTKQKKESFNLKTEQWNCSNQNDQKKKKKEWNKVDSLRDLEDNINLTNIPMIGLPEEEEREKGADILFEEMTAGDFPNLEKETDIQVQEAQRVKNKMSPKRHTLGHVIIKMSKVKDKERILKAAREHVQGTSCLSQ